MSTRRLAVLLLLVLLVCFGILGFFGREVYRQAPPIPSRVLVKGLPAPVATASSILDGQEAWQSMGGQQVGSVWGHGAYQAPDWTADWLHREAVALLDLWSRRDHGAKSYQALDPEAQGALRARLVREMRTNRYDPSTGDLVLSADRWAAMEVVAAHYEALFGDDPSMKDLRTAYALQADAIPEAGRRQALTHFFFWTAWASATERPGTSVTYTNNWPHEPLIGNRPSGANVLWSIVSVVVLLAGIGALVWFEAGRRKREDEPVPPEHDPLDQIRLTPSMRAVAKFCVVVVALFAVQALLGALTAHYTIEGDGFFGIPIFHVLPYAVTRTWHVQTGVFWIATAFLATGLFLAPAVGGREPRFQRLGVNILFGALLLVVGGSLAGEWLGIHHRLGGSTFLFGQQGYEYVDLGRFWQIALYAGLFLWLGLTLRGLWPALRERSSRRPLVLLFAGSAGAIGLFYGAGLLYGARTHLTVMEYWRWWVVHLWVEGFMEVFATAVIAFLFHRFGLIRAKSATRGVLASSAIFLLGGIPGTFHHLYFAGTPVGVMAIGATFSALEVVPLVLIGREAWETMRRGRRAPWMRRYRWPLRCFVAVAFWNLVGAGLFGFLINPPIALYYMQGLNTTPVHGHAALFGVYGLLAIGLTLVVLRRLRPEGEWRTGSLRFAFWAMNVGLGLMLVLSLLPIGLLQAHASMETGLWYARSADFLQQPSIVTLRWLRIFGDLTFLAGVAGLVTFVLGLYTGWSFEKRPREPGGTPGSAGIPLPALNVPGPR